MTFFLMDPHSFACVCVCVCVIVIDRMATEMGHQIVRLPPYHCRYNAIELIWTQVKSYIAKRNDFRMANAKFLLTEAYYLMKIK